MITAPITTTKVGNEIGVSTHNVGALCTNSNINKWSKYKPVKIDKASKPTETEYKRARYGLSIPYFNRIVNMASYIKNNTPLPDNGPFINGDFGYEKPQNGDALRLGDFDNYIHNSEQPINANTQGTIKLDSSNRLTLYFDLGVDNSVYYRLTDINLYSYVGNIAEDLNSWYLGICLTNGSRTVVMTQSTTLSEVYSQGARFYFDPFNTSWLGTYTIFPFISSMALTTAQTAPADTGYFIPLTFAVSSITIEAFKPSVTVTITSAYKDTSISKRLIYYSFRIDNSDDTGYTSGFITVTVYNSSGVEINSIQLSAAQIPAASYIAYSNKSIDVSSLSNVNAASTLKISFDISGINFKTSANITTGPTPIV